MNTDIPQTMKALGAKVKNFERSKWSDNCSHIAKVAIKAKFMQNPMLKKTLLETKPKTLVEAAPKDKIWGIGIYMYDPEILRKINEWGKNLQGKCLMEIRESLST